MTDEPTPSGADFTRYLWLLKLGALVNLYFLVDTFGLPSGSDAHIVVPAQILFAVSAYRCLFPVRYEDNVVFHDSPLSSIFVTRLLATFVEVAWIYQFSRVVRLLNVEDLGWIDALSWLMVLQVVISQGFVWAAIATRRFILYFFEELGWALIFVANTVASVYLYATVDPLGDGESLLVLNLLFGVVYLPWQFFHLRALRGEAGTGGDTADGLRRSIRVRNRRTNADAWGGFIGLTWMASYWAILIPPWVHHVVEVFSD